MKKVIWKFELTDKGVQNISLPKDYQFLTIQTQNGTPCIWVLVNPDEEKIDEQFEIYGTGHNIHFDMGISRDYLGTFQDSYLVWHLFRYTGV